MTIGILYVGIGKYIQLWDKFYESCEKYFLPQVEKEYFVFTDHSLEGSSKVKVFYQEDLGWPKNVLFRYRFFLSIKKELEPFNYLFFFNGNTEFLQPISPEEFLPGEEDGFLTGLVWHINENKPVDKRPYERRPASRAYVPYGEGEHYYQAGLIGGKSDVYLKMLEVCELMTKADLEQDIITIWHDESYLNKYLLDKRIKVLTTEYGRPQQWSHPKEPKIIFRDKKAVLGKTFIRRLKKEKTQSSFSEFVEALKKVCKSHRSDSQ